MAESKLENAPVAEKGSTDSVGGLADAQLSDIKATGSSTADTSTESFGKSSDFSFSNEQGDTFQTDKNGQVTNFTYNEDNGGQSFSDIKRDEDGNVTEFKTSDGNVWTKQPGDPTSPFEAERNGDGWMYKNEETGEEPRSPVDLGEVKIDQNGVTASGRNADYLALPEE